MITPYITLKKFTGIFVGLTMSFNVLANVDVDTRGLTNTQKAELVKQAEAMSLFVMFLDW
jgi:hypothetical protein